MKCRDFKKVPSNQSGLSLIELMVALTLSSLLMLGFMRMFMDSTRSNATDSALAQVQDSARIAMEMIKRDLRIAGYKGSCVNGNTEEFIDSSSDTLLDTLANQAVISPAETDTGSIISQSDQLTILRASEQPDLTAARIASLDNKVNIDPASSLSLSAATPLFFSDCNNFALFTAVLSVDDDIVTPPAIYNVMEIPAICSTTPTDESCPLLNSAINYQINEITDNGRLGSDGQPVFGLYLNNVHEMVEGVENLQVLYGFATGDTTRYCDAATSGTCTGDLTHLRISLVVASSNNVLDSAKAFDNTVLNTHGFDPFNRTPDRRLRRTFTTTVQLRNQG